MNENDNLSISCNVNVESFVLKQLKLLEDEKEAEIEENKILRESSSLKTLQKKGICIPKLHVTNLTTGLFGRIMLSFQTYFNKPLPAHSISSGDIVGVGKINSDGRIEVITSGILFRASDSTLTIAFEKNSDALDLDNDDNLVIIKLANDITYKRLKKALKTLDDKRRDSHLVSVLFGERQPSFLESSTLNNLVFYNNRLNLAQQEAVKFSLSQKEVSILHGPPGTGKTTTLIECILQAVSQKLKIIACAPSNVAVDNLVEKLASFKVKMVRLGHPARFHSNIHQYSLDAIVSRYDGKDVIAEMHQEMEKLTKKTERTKCFGSRKDLWKENKSLLKEIKEKEKEIVKQVLKNADVILSTLTSASDDGPLKHVEKDHFDICFIDECSQALEAACWIPLTLVKRCVLAGDHNQLPPTIISKNAARGGLSITLMERLLKLHGDAIKKMLTVQYRMNEQIMHWSSNQFYDNSLIADDSVCSHLLKDLPNVACNENTDIPLLLIDTAGCDLYELETPDEDSKGNEGEADIVSYHAKLLINSGVPCSEIAIITPYNLQVDLLKSRLSKIYPKLEIKTVDGFQGREKEAVLLSLVRSNADGEVGFLAENRRINVAITRAKRHLAVVCDTQTVSHNSFLKTFIKYCEEKGEVRTAFEYEKETGQYSMLVKKKERSDKQKSSKKKILNKQQSDSINKEDMKKVKTDKEENGRLAAEIKLKQIIENFIASKEESHRFSTSLSPFERKIVHEISEKVGLIHISSGEGNERCIQIEKCSAASSTCNPEKNTNYTETTNSSEIVNEVAPEKIKSLLEYENNLVVKCLNVPSSSEFELKTSCDEKNMKSQNFKVPEKSFKLKNESDSKKSKPKLKNLKLNDATEENFDDIIQQVMKADNTCCYENCKKSVAVLSQLCDFCKCRFCFYHFIPEAHGCGDAAKAHARSQIRKDGVLYPGSGRPEKKTDPLKQSYLQKKLDKKLNDLSQKRKTKQKK